MDKSWILIVNPNYWLDGETKKYILREIVYEDPYAFKAFDRDSALEYLQILLSIKAEEIL